MCGIAGVLNLEDGEAPSESALRRMLAMIRHRGPDQFGIYRSDRVALGNARLSILDLAGGQQPIGNEDRTRWIVFNGEIFNYRELRSDLETRGHRFSTRSDTEVVLHLYEEFGCGCVSRLNGQFAIAIWDENERSLFLARDRLGIRPLFYTTAGGRLVFGSEIKALLVDPEVRAELDPLALEQVFSYWSTLSPRTVFRGIRDLPPGHYMLIGERETRIEAYWQLARSYEDAASATREKEQELVEEFRELLLDATRIRLHAEVPVGAYLSGGLDSSTIAAMIRSSGSRLDTFSIAFRDQQFDESEHQQRMAKFLGTDHQVVDATCEEIGRVFPEVIWHTETPILRTSPAPMYLLSRLVHQSDYKVVLTGEGADEFLAGYDIFKEARIRRFWARQPDSEWRHLLLTRIYPDISNLRSTGSYLAAFFRAGLMDLDDPAYSHAIRWKNNRRTLRFLSPDLRARVAAERETEAADLELPPEFQTLSALQKSQYLEVSVFMSQYLLSSQGDRPAMAHSVEGRYPFLDFRVAEFCNRLPARMKLRGLTEKVILRKVARDLLPEEIRRRPKRPYRAPIHRCFFNESTQDYVKELLSPAALRSSGLFHPEAVKQLVEKGEQGRLRGETDDMALVGILSAQLVHELFVRDLRSAPLLSEDDDVKCVDRRLSAGTRKPV